MSAVFYITLFLNTLQYLRAPLLRHVLFIYHYTSTNYTPRLFYCMKGIPMHRTSRDTNLLLSLKSNKINL